ncbi:hypothetical protein GGR42_001442 [Saonia flava]|uniref:DUF4249 domain-containing protein n=1 Tax=Saonia flava TaxID=523696 RepID=A0A846QVN2_9FLAO|nr:DUF4249 domain-containing protein [Saonia flava]NJB70980.1 hypothetical protein [Saonia flava]
MQTIRTFRIFLSIFLLAGCSDPVAPEFEYIDGLVYIEGLASTITGLSKVTITTSDTEFGIRKNTLIDDAQVSFRNVDTAEQVDLVLDTDTYIPPNDFVVLEGETWEMQVLLSDGRQFQSTPEKVTVPVDILEINATYDTELFFSEAFESFIPGHSVLISFEDPSEMENYYYWRFRSYEPITICANCDEGTYFRNGICEPHSGYTLVPYFSYLCDSKCWRIRYNANIQIFTDDFVDGKLVNNLSIANIPLYTKENIVVEIQQFSLSSSAYKYYKTLKDIIDNSGGFNAPTPAALIGNLYNPNDANEVVLGRFTVAASSTKSIFIDRSDIKELRLERYVPFGNSEGGPGFVVPDPLTLSIPCEESLYRTSIRPEGWLD